MTEYDSNVYKNETLLRSKIKKTTQYGSDVYRKRNIIKKNDPVRVAPEKVNV